MSFCNENSRYLRRGRVLKGREEARVRCDTRFAFLYLLLDPAGHLPRKDMAAAATLCLWVFFFLSLWVSLMAVDIPPVKGPYDDAADAVRHGFDLVKDHVSAASKILPAGAGAATALFPAVISAAASLVVLY